MIGILSSSQRRMSFNEIAPYLSQIEAQEKLAGAVLPQSRTRFQAAVVQLYGNLGPLPEVEARPGPGGSKDFLGELLRLREGLSDGVGRGEGEGAGKPHDEAKAAALIAEGQKFVAMAESTDLLAIPARR